MTYEEFASLTDEEKNAVYTALDEKGVLYDDMEAERNSFQKENDLLRKEMAELKTEMKKTKELNFTLTRSVKTEPEKSAEDILHEMFK